MTHAIRMAQRFPSLRFFAFCPDQISIFLHLFSFQDAVSMIYYIIVKMREMMIYEDCSPKEDCTHA